MDELITEAIQIGTQWVGVNPLTILLAGNVIQFFYHISTKTKNVVDDRAVSYLAWAYRKITGRNVIPPKPVPKVGL